MRIFKRADDEDRAGNASKCVAWAGRARPMLTRQDCRETARCFYVASNFLTVLRQFGDVDEQIAEMTRYALWKCSDIRNALREGRKPHPGPPGWTPDVRARRQRAPRECG